MNRRWLLGGMTMAMIGVAELLCAEDALTERRDALAKWMEVRRLISAELRDWTVAKETLEERRAMMRREIAAWREKIAQTENELATLQQERKDLDERRDELLRLSGAVAESVARMEAKLREWLPRAPAPLKERVKLLAQRLPEDPAATRLSLGERAGNVIGILNEIDKFAREIVVSSEVRELADGTSAEVSVLYVGLGQAWYCNPRRGIAGVGRPGPSGWIWTEQNELAFAVAEAIAVYRNERPAEYVLLPISVR